MALSGVNYVVAPLSHLHGSSSLIILLRSEAWFTTHLDFLRSSNLVSSLEMVFAFFLTVLLSFLTTGLAAIALATGSGTLGAAASRPTGAFLGLVAVATGNLGLAAVVRPTGALVFGLV